VLYHALYRVLEAVSLSYAKFDVFNNNNDNNNHHNNNNKFYVFSCYYGQYRKLNSALQLQMMSEKSLKYLKHSTN